MLCSPFAAVVEASIGVLCAVTAAHYEEENRGIVFHAVGFVFEPPVEPPAACGVEFGESPFGVGSEVDIALVSGVGSLGSVCPWPEDHVCRGVVAFG